MPKLTGSDHEQLVQLKSFLHQHIEQLQFALSTLEQRMESIEKQKKGEK
jgi:hypothetical protein